MILSAFILHISWPWFCFNFIKRKRNIEAIRIDFKLFFTPVEKFNYLLSTPIKNL